MKKALLLSFLLVLLKNALFSQNINPNALVRWKKSTISFGVIDTLFIMNEKRISKTPYYQAIGTGIIFYVKRNSESILTIVTAKHMLFDGKEKRKNINIRFDWASDRSVNSYLGISIPLILQDSTTWVGHPDLNVDLAAIPMFFDKKLLEGHSPTYQGYVGIASNDDVYEGQGILALGFPSIGQYNRLTHPILRRGVVSWKPTVNPNSTFLIDCNIYPGNSGGPVFSDISMINSKGIFGLNGYQFLGIVTRKARDTNFVKNKFDQDVTDSSGNKIFNYESVGLGIVEPAYRVRELLDHINTMISKLTK